MIQIFGDWLRPVSPSNQYTQFEHFEFEENISLRSQIEAPLAQLVRKYHTMTMIQSEMFDALGFPKVGNILREDNRPRNLNTMKAHFGEILGCEFGKEKLGYDFPVLRLRYNPNTEQSMKGDDVLGFQFASSDGSKNHVLVGEAKYRNTFRNEVVLEAYQALVGNLNYPEPLSLEFTSTILEARGDRKLANQVRQVSFQLRDLDSEKVQRHYLLLLATLGKPQKPFLRIEERRKTLENLVAVNVCFEKTDKSPDDFESFLIRVFQN